MVQGRNTCPFHCQTILEGQVNKVFPLQTNPQCAFIFFLQDVDTEMPKVASSVFLSTNR